ncbi:MAG: hypothetical protein HY361_01685 [Candidatus Aenigmarchaeota archaeon]|nr:hypothetical protein [Candidatus Aenigmarchaeota archaeon]
MLFFGHIGISAFFGLFLYLSPLIVGISSILPDFVDKGLLLAGLSPYTRLVAHNLFFGPALSAIVYLATKRKAVAIAVLFGTYMHLIEDIRTPLPWLWPLVTYDLVPVTGIKIVVDLFEIFTETIGLSLLVSLFVFKKNLIDAREKIIVVVKDFYDKRLVKKI